MSKEEIVQFMLEGGHIDCGNSYDDKIAVLCALEEVGFTIGFEKRRADNYRFVYFARAGRNCEKIHMKTGRFGDLPHGTKTVPAEVFLSMCDMEENEFETCDLSCLYEWIA